MSEFQLTKHNLQQLMDFAQLQLESTDVVKVEFSSASTGKWSLAKLWRVWVGKAADYMASKGQTISVYANGKVIQERKFNAHDAHELFTMYCLGCDKDGVRLSWAKKPHDGMQVATQGQRFDALRKLEIWCVEKGIQLLKPRDSEYCTLEKQQER